MGDGPDTMHTSIQESATVSSLAHQREPFHVPIENTIVNYGRTKRQLYLTKPNEIDYLFNILNNRFDHLIKKEVERKRDKEEKDLGMHGQFGQTSWSLPSHIIVFLENSIKNISNLKLRLIPWVDFKKQIFDIIDHRIEHCPEIHGIVNTSYMTMDEHLMVFMCDQFV